MTLALTHPWQSGPVEIISYGLEHLRSHDESHRRIGFLLIDLGVETLLKTFLSLPENVTHASTSYFERKKAVNGNFHELIAGLIAAAPDRLGAYDRDHIEFYHGLRNQLYHQGNGITVSSEHATGYAELAVGLLERLLDVKLLGTALGSCRFEQEKKALLKKVGLTLGRFEEVVELVIEQLAPRLLLPSTIRKMRELARDAGLDQLRDRQCRFWITMEGAIDDQDIRKWVSQIVDERATQYSLENTQLLFALLDDPFSVYLLLVSEFVLRNDKFQVGGMWGGRLEEVYETFDDEEHILALYESVKYWHDQMQDAIWFDPQHQQIQEAFVNIALRETAKLESTLVSLSSWLDGDKSTSRA